MTSRAARWRLLLTAPLPGVENMALDAALMRRAVRTGETVLRVYGWATPTLSFGRNQAVNGAYRRDRVAEMVGAEVVRRATGGRAILHDREITYSVTAPAPADAATPGESYAAINRLLLDALRGLGVDAGMAVPAGRAPRPGLAPCFDSSARGEIVVGGRKLVGSAQLRDFGALLQHGSILVENDQTMLETLLPDAMRRARRATPAPEAPAMLRALLGRSPSLDEFADALENAVRARVDRDARPLTLDLATLSDARAAARQFADESWTWRR